jgi:nucleotide-binding universal stress UspA family protein
MFKHLLVATDGSERSDRAVAFAARLARQTGAGLSIVSVMSPFTPQIAMQYPWVSGIPQADILAATEREVQERLDRAVALAARSDVAAHKVLVTEAQPWRGILDAAKQTGCDAICMASHGRHGVAAVLLGSETTKVLAHGEVPVLVVK